MLEGDSLLLMLAQNSLRLAEYYVILWQLNLKTYIVCAKLKKYMKHIVHMYRKLF